MTNQNPTTPTIQSIGDIQPERNINDALNELRSTIPGIHRTGTSGLGAPCPKCGGRDRFWSSSRTNYNYWQCGSAGRSGCGHTAWVGQIQGARVIPNPLVKAWGIQPQDGQKIEWVRAAYASLAEYAHRHLDQGMTYLFERGVTEETARAQGLGYLDKNLYIQWWRGLTPELRAGVEFGGLPDCDSEGNLKGRGRGFVKGYQGKIVYPYYDHSGLVIDIRTRSISPNDKIKYMGPMGKYEDRQAHIPYMPVGAVTGPVILTEGEFKTLVPLSQGCLYPVYSLRGTSDPIVPILKYFYNRPVILAFDNDEAGTRATVDVGRKLRAKGIDVLVLSPGQLGMDDRGKGRGIDDYINDEGIDSFNDLLAYSNLWTLPEFEAALDPELIEKIPNPKADVGTVRRWTPAEHVDTFAHTKPGRTVSPDEATEQLKVEIADHVENFQTGQGQLFSALPAGTGKTTATLEAVQQVIETENGTISVFLPNHDQIKEKINDGTLEGFQEIWGRKWDKNEEGVRNCHQADTASTLTQLGYNVSTHLCPSCDMLQWCRSEGYKSQFAGKANRAYVHNHIFTDYPDGSDVTIIDEATHKTFIEETQIYGGHIQRALAEGLNNQAERTILESLSKLFEVPNIDTLQGIEFYTVLQRFYPNLISEIDQWGDGLEVQQSLFDMVMDCTSSQDRNVYEVEQLPPAFANALFSVLNEDVRRIAGGEAVTGRIKLINAGSHRYIEIVSSKNLPDWYYKTPTILLNATANETVSKELWGIEGQLKSYSPDVAIMDGNTILQDVTLNNAKSGLLGKGETVERQRAKWLDQIRDHIGDHPQNDVVLITVKALEKTLGNEFPEAKIAYYGALEGKNDLQAGLTILCNPPAINLPAIQDEARALWDDIDTTLTRKSVAYDYIMNDEGQYLSVEQIDAVDPRLSALIDQHRDALTIQAIGRARLVRNSGRHVVVMFARPIPGYSPTNTIYTRSQKNEYRANKTVERLVMVAAGLLELHNSFSVSTLAAAAGSKRETVYKYWQEIIDNMGVQWVELPCFQQMNGGGIRSVTVRLAVNVEGLKTLRNQIKNIEIPVCPDDYYIYIIANGEHSNLSIPKNIYIDIKLIKPTDSPEVETAEVAPEAEPEQNLTDCKPVPVVVPVEIPMSPMDRILMMELDLDPDDPHHQGQYLKLKLMGSKRRSKK